jgi:hypothetical protein
MDEDFQPKTQWSNHLPNILNQISLAKAVQSLDS